MFIYNVDIWDDYYICLSAYLELLLDQQVHNLSTVVQNNLKMKKMVQLHAVEVEIFLL